MSQVNTELGYSSTATISLNDSAVRTLAGVSSGAISMSNLQGKSNTTTLYAGSLSSDSGIAVLSTSWSTQTVSRGNPLYFTVSYSQDSGQEESFWTDVYYRFWAGSSGDFSSNYGGWTVGSVMYGSSSTTITITPNSAGYFSLGFRLGSRYSGIETHNVPIDFYVN